MTWCLFLRDASNERRLFTLYSSMLLFFAFLANAISESYQLIFQGSLYGELYQSSNSVFVNFVFYLIISLYFLSSFSSLSIIACVILKGFDSLISLSISKALLSRKIPASFWGALPNALCDIFADVMTHPLFDHIPLNANPPKLDYSSPVY